MCKQEVGKDTGGDRLHACEVTRQLVCSCYNATNLPPLLKVEVALHAFEIAHWCWAFNNKEIRFLTQQKPLPKK